MTWLDALAAPLLIAGVAFYAVGSVGLLRFPDVYARLHALAKVDNLGLGLLMTGLLLRSDSWSVALKLLFIWLLAIAASATATYLVANSAHRAGAPMNARGAREH